MSKVNFLHRRPMVDGRISNSGGFTVAFEEVDEGIRYAVAYCHPNDNFNKKTGRIKAEGRLNSPRYVDQVDMNFDAFKEWMHSM